MVVKLASDKNSPLLGPSFLPIRTPLTPSKTMLASNKTNRR